MSTGSSLLLKKLHSKHIFQELVEKELSHCANMLSYGIFCCDKGMFQYKVRGRPLLLLGQGLWVSSRSQTKKANIGLHHFWIFPEFVQYIFYNIWRHLFFKKKHAKNYTLQHVKLDSGVRKSSDSTILTKCVNCTIVQPFGKAFQQ